MTCDDIIKLALEAGFCKDSNGIYSRRAVTPDSDLLPSLERFATLAAEWGAKQEREACCKIVHGQCESDNVAQRTVEVIRARGQENKS